MGRFRERPGRAAAAVAVLALGTSAGVAQADVPIPLPGTTTVGDDGASQTTIESTKPWALAAFGDRIVWIRDLGPGRQALVTRDNPLAADRVLVARLPFHATRVALGTDARDHLTAVLERNGTPDTPPGAPRTTPIPHGELWAAGVDAPTVRLRRLRVSGSPGSESAPGLRRGVLSFVRIRRVRGRATETLRVGTLNGTSSRVVWRAPAQTQVVASGVGAGRRVAWTTYRLRYSASLDRSMSTWDLRTARPGRRSQLIEHVQDHGGDFYGYSALTMAPDGRTLTVAVSDADLHNDEPRVAPQPPSGTYPVTEAPSSAGALHTFDLATRRRTAVVQGVNSVAVPIQSGGTVSYASSALDECFSMSHRDGTVDCSMSFDSPPAK